MKVALEPVSVYECNLDLQIVKSFPTPFIFVRWPSQICDGTGQSTKTLGLPKSKHWKNCAGFVASLQWTSNGFQRSRNKRRATVLQLLNSIKAHFNPVKCSLAATSLACLFSAQGCHVCRMIFLSGVISHPATPEDEPSGNLQQLVWSHGETAVLVVSCKAVGFLGVAACCTWRNNQEPQTSPSLQIANGWKEQRHRQGRSVQHAGYKNFVCYHPWLKVHLWRWETLMRADQIHKKTSWRVSAFCVSPLFNLNLKDTDAPPELVKTWH